MKSNVAISQNPLGCRKIPLFIGRGQGCESVTDCVSELMVWERGRKVWRPTVPARAPLPRAAAPTVIRALNSRLFPLQCLLRSRSQPAGKIGDAPLGLSARLSHSPVPVPRSFLARLSRLFRSLSSDGRRFRL
jgi:hypothetical protein